MTTQEVASHYQGLMNQKKFLEVQDTYYADDVVCQEMEKAAAMGRAGGTQGPGAIKAKGIARRATIETSHSYVCSDPIVSGEFFSVVLSQDVTFKGKPRATLTE